MSEILREPVTGPSVWKRDDFIDDDSWIHVFSDDELKELETSTHRLRERGLSPHDFNRDDFPLPTLGPKLADMLEDIEYGRGFVLLRGIDVSRFDEDGLKLLYWGLGTHLGSIVSQNSWGDLLGVVTDLEAGKYKDGGYYEDNVRGHRTNALIEPHSDSCDVTGLLCVRPAKKGGESLLCSSMAIYNHILEHHPELIEPLAEGYHIDLIGKGRKDIEITEHRVPVYSWFAGHLSCRFNKRQLELGSVKAGEDLNGLRQAALDKVRELSERDEFLLPMDFRPGDIQLINNHTTLHSRTAYTDGDTPETRRLLYRLWLSIPNGRPLAPEFANRLNSGGRGGVTKRLDGTEETTTR